MLGKVFLTEAKIAIRATPQGFVCTFMTTPRCIHVLVVLRTCEFGGASSIHLLHPFSLYDGFLLLWC